MQNNLISEQKRICKKYGTEWMPSPAGWRIGISNDIKSGKMPINGLRHEPENGTLGWYIWCGGEINNDPKLFDAIHVEHLEQECPLVLKYLGLPPGWRFQIDDKGYEDVWEDKQLLNNEIST
jgi:hypothetical protein